jgi:hypothetical protein
VWVCISYGKQGLDCSLGGGGAPVAGAAAAAAADSVEWMQCFRFNEAAETFDYWVSNHTHTEREGG